MCASVAAGAQKSPSDEAAIRAQRERSNRAIAAHDVAGTISMMAPDYVSVSSRNSRSMSRDDAQREYASLFTTRAGVVFVRTPSSVAVNKSWGQAAEQGKWTGKWSASGAEIRVGGDYFAKWVKLGAEWKILSETFVQTSCAGDAYCGAPPSVTDANELARAVAEIQPLFAEMMAAANAHDTDRHLALYLHSPELVFVANDETIRGFDSLRVRQLQWWQNGKSDAVYTLVGSPEYIMPSRDVVVQTYSLSSPRSVQGVTHEARLNVTDIWRRTTIGWRVVYAHESIVVH